MPFHSSASLSPTCLFLDRMRRVAEEGACRAAIQRGILKDILASSPSKNDAGVLLHMERYENMGNLRSLQAYSETLAAKGLDRIKPLPSGPAILSLPPRPSLPSATARPSVSIAGLYSRSTGELPVTPAIRPSSPLAGRERHPSTPPSPARAAKSSSPAWRSDAVSVEKRYAALANSRPPPSAYQRIVNIARLCYGDNATSCRTIGRANFVRFSPATLSERPALIIMDRKYPAIPDALGENAGYDIGEHIARRLIQKDKLLEWFGKAKTPAARVAAYWHMIVRNYKDLSDLPALTAVPENATVHPDDLVTSQQGTGCTTPGPSGPPVSWTRDALPPSPVSVEGPRKSNNSDERLCKAPSDKPSIYSHYLQEEVPTRAWTRLRLFFKAHFDTSSVVAAEHVLFEKASPDGNTPASLTILGRVVRPDSLPSTVASKENCLIREALARYAVEHGALHAALDAHKLSNADYMRDARQLADVWSTFAACASPQPDVQPTIPAVKEEVDSETEGLGSRKEQNGLPQQVAPPTVKRERSDSGDRSLDPRKRKRVSEVPPADQQGSADTVPAAAHPMLSSTIVKGTNAEALPPGKELYRSVPNQAHSAHSDYLVRALLANIRAYTVGEMSLKEALEIFQDCSASTETIAEAHRTLQAIEAALSRSPPTETMAEE